MRAIMLAAGKGNRLGDITKNTPKPMLKIRGEIILEHNIKLLKRFGIKDIYINLHCLPEVIQEYFGNGKKWGVNIRYSYEENILGTAGGAKKIAKDWNKPFLLLYGDNFFTKAYHIPDLIKEHREKNALATIAVFPYEGDTSQKGVVVVEEDGRIQRFVEKPKEGVGSNLVNAAMHIFEPGVLGYIGEGVSDFTKEIFPNMIEKGERLFAWVVPEPPIAIDTPELYKEAQ